MPPLPDAASNPANPAADLPSPPQFVPVVPPRPDWLTPLLVTTLAYLFLYHLISATPLLRFPPAWAHSKTLGWVGYVISVGPLTLLQVLIVRYLSAWRGSAAAWLGGVAAAAALWGFYLFLYGRSVREMLIALPLGPWMNLALIAATVLLGMLVSRVIRDPQMLLPVLIVGGLVDYWGVYYGTTQHFMKAAPQLVETVSAKVPALSFGGIPVTNTIGPGDFVFLGLFFACLYRFEMNVAGTFRAFVILLFVALGVATVFPIPVPALVPMGIAVLAVNARRLKLSRAETFALVYLVAALVILLTGLALWKPFGK